VVRFSGHVSLRFDLDAGSPAVAARRAGGGLSADSRRGRGARSASHGLRGAASGRGRGARSALVVLVRGRAGAAVVALALRGACSCPGAGAGLGRALYSAVLAVCLGRGALGRTVPLRVFSARGLAGSFKVGRRGIGSHGRVTGRAV
jgi:hypothetical protein